MTRLATASARVSEGLDIVEAIGDDHAVTIHEVCAAARDAGALDTYWAAYVRHWGGFSGARLDPMFDVLTHPAQMTGTAYVTDGAPSIVVGTGPSLAPALPALMRMRPALHLITSPRGAEVLARADLVPDLVVVEHQTALDAQFAVSERAYTRNLTLGRVPLVAADSRTPAALLADVPGDRLFVPTRWPSWGLWPATAVALALGGGAGRIGLVGIDLGSSAQPDPAHAALAELLGLLAATAGVPCLDLGAGGAPKAHWSTSTVSAIAAHGAVRPLELSASVWRSPVERRAAAEVRWRRLAPIAAEAAATLAAASAVRDGDHSGRAVDRLRDGLGRLLAAGRDRPTRVDVQDGLGVSFLPRYWRRPPDLARGVDLWRPAALASHECVSQYRALGERLAMGA